MTTRPTTRLSPLPIVAVGLGAFLLFLLQPMAARALLPRFGGVPSVWAVSLACYQTFLFAGYLLAHLLRRHASPRIQGLVLTVVMGLGAATLPLLPLGSSSGSDTVLGVALALTLGVGPVFVALAAVGPLVQAWAGGTSGDRVYGLYAVSNAASLIALLGYPTVFERLVDMTALSWIWGLLFLAELVLVGVMAWRHRADVTADDAKGESTGLMTLLRWSAWAAGGVVVLNAATTVAAQDLASIPLLWVAPLSLYLVTWIVAFSGRLPDGTVGSWGLAGGSLVLILLALHDGVGVGPMTRILLLLAAMTAACLAAHGALYASRPDAGRLTSFYLAIAAGGAVGGLISGLAAPSLGPRWTELALGFGSVALLAVATGLGSARERMRALPAAAVVIVLVGVLVVTVADTPTGTILQHRDFHGLVRVTEHDADDPARHRRVLTHGATKHGAQFFDPVLGREPTTYFARVTGCGVAVGAQRARTGPSLDVGIVGLGVGTVAAYGRPGDEITFYELSPAVVDLATGDGALFSYLDDSPADIDVVVGDARISMVRELDDAEGPRLYDLMILDAFAGDAVPVHLLTREAFDVYKAHLAPDGMIAAHVSSNWVDLRPVLYAWAESAGWRALTVSNRSRGLADVDQISTWVILFRDLEGLRVLRDQCVPLMEQGVIAVENMNDVDYGGLEPWTDERGGVLDVLTTRVGARTGR